MTDCREREDGCFSFHLRWRSSKGSTEDYRTNASSNSPPVVYVPVNYGTPNRRDMLAKHETTAPDDSCDSSPLSSDLKFTYTFENRLEEYGDISGTQSPSLDLLPACYEECNDITAAVGHVSR